MGGKDDKNEKEYLHTTQEGFRIAKMANICP